MPFKLAWIFCAKCFLCYRIDDVIDTSHMNWLAKTNSIQCGMKPEDMRGRVINGRVVKQPYPWLFYVLKQFVFVCFVSYVYVYIML